MENQKMRWTFVTGLQSLFVLILVIGGGIEASAQSGLVADKPVVKTPVFDVATIKPNETGSGSTTIDINNGQFMANNIKMETLIELAFNTREDLISGLPTWARGAHYDMMAKTTEVDAVDLKKLTDDQQREMLRQLLAERLHVKAHFEVKQMPVYDLLVAKGGIKFPVSKVSHDSDDCGNMHTSNTTMTATCVLIDDITRFLAHQVTRTVLDKTGLPAKERYDLKIQWRPLKEGPLSDADAQLPSLFDALQEQLGLRLESTKGPVDTLVVDQIDKPTEN